MVNANDIQAGFRQVQDKICDFLSEADGVRYTEDRWDYHKGGGGGVTRVWEHARLLEKGGVNFSGIQGESLPPSAATQFQIDPDTPFLATGVSLVIHPWNPRIPTIHMNIRYFEAGDLWWFGGGMDLTPYYPNVAQIVRFHQQMKAVCDRHDEDYELHKKTCDEYFFLKHRQEPRGIGGLFFDHMRADKDKHFAFVTDLGNSFPDIYGPFIVEGKDIRHTDDEREFQLYRRGRYVEFNLVYDRGTLFGLQSQGRTESILMSLPATAHWRYNWTPESGTREALLTDYYLVPRDWASMDPATEPAPAGV